MLTMSLDKEDATDAAFSHVSNQGNSFRDVKAQQAVVKGIQHVRSENRALRDARAQNPLPPAIERVVEQYSVSKVILQDVTQVPGYPEILLERADHVIPPGRVERVFDVQRYQEDVLVDQMPPLLLVRYCVHDTPDGVYREMPITEAMLFLGKATPFFDGLPQSCPEHALHHLSNGI